MKYMKLPKQARESLLEGLKQMPDFLAQSFAQLPASLYAVPGPQGTFSPVEQAWHLADLEAMGFAERIRRLRAEQNPRLPDFAGEIVARERNYRSLPLIDGIAAFRQARDANLAALRSLSRVKAVCNTANPVPERSGTGLFSVCPTRTEWNFTWHIDHHTFQLTARSGHPTS